jgi:hypothetical protein
MSGLRCQAKRGVLTLRRCDEPVDNVCSKCQRPTCAAHFSPQAVLTCFDCAARQSPAPERVRPEMTDYDSPGWSYGMRNWLIYSSARDAAVSFDRNDERSFEHARDDNPASEPETGRSLLDS